MWKLVIDISREKKFDRKPCTFKKAFNNGTIQTHKLLLLPNRKLGILRPEPETALPPQGVCFRSLRLALHPATFPTAPPLSPRRPPGRRRSNGLFPSRADLHGVQHAFVAVRETTDLDHVAVHHDSGGSGGMVALVHPVLEGVWIASHALTFSWHGVSFLEDVLSVNLMGFWSYGAICMWCGKMKVW